MFVPSTGAADGFTSLFKPTDISAEEENLKFVNQAAEKKRLHDDAIQAAKARRLEEIAKEPEHTRKEDDSYFASAIANHNKNIYDNTSDYISGDINRSTKAAIAMKDVTSQLNSDAKASNDIGKNISNINTHIAAEKAKSEPTVFRGEDTWEKEQKKGFKDVDFSKIPQPVYNYQKDNKENLVPYLKQTGTVTEKPLLVNGKPQYLPNGGIAMVQSEEADPVALNNDFHAHYVANPNLPKETELTFGEREARKTPLRPSLVTEGKLVQGKVPTYEDYKGTDENGVSGINTPQFYADQLTPFVPTKSKIVNSAGAQSVTSGGGPTYAQTIPITVKGTKDNPNYSYPLSPDGKAVNTPIGNENYDVSDIQDIHINADGFPTGTAIIAKANDHNLLQEAKFEKAKAAYPKKVEDLAKWQIQMLAAADAGKDEKGKPLTSSIRDQRKYITETFNAKKDELLKNPPKQEDFPLEVEKKPIEGDDLINANKGINLLEFHKTGRTAGARRIDWTTKQEQNNAPAQTEKKKIYKGLDNHGNPIFE